MIKRMVTYVRYLLPVLILSWLAGMVAELGQVFVAWQTGRILISPSTQLQSLAWVLAAGVILAALCAFAEQYMRGITSPSKYWLICVIRFTPKWNGWLRLAFLPSVLVIY